MPVMIRLVTLAVLIAVGFSVRPAHAADPTTLIVVFDGSGSMWGKLDGEKQAKLTHVRDGLKTALAALKPDVRVGLASFGHRRGGDCSDVQVIHAAEPLSTSGDRISNTLEKLNPRGRGPITAALKEAAKALSGAPGKKNILLIHDDPDNCQADPCAALGDLQSSAPGLAIHVVGLGLKSEDATRLMCLTRPTDGRHVDAQSAAQASEGLAEIMRLVSLNAAPAPQPAHKPVAAASAPQPAAALSPPVKPAEPATVARKALRTDGPSGLRLVAVPILGAEPFDRDVQWTVVQSGATGGPLLSGPLFSGMGQDLAIPLPAGSYAVEARDGLVIARQTVTVAAAGETRGDLILNAGIIRLVAPPSRDGGLPGDATITLFESLAKSGPRGPLPGKPLGVLTAREVTTMVPAGAYVARVEQGLLRSDRALTVTAGQVADLTLAVATGRLSVSVVAADAAARVPIIISITEDDPDALNGRRELVRSAAPNPDFALAPGTYSVIARQGAVEVRERVAIGAGEAIARKLTLPSARLTLGSRLAGRANEASDEPVSYRIERLDIVPPEIFRANSRDATLDLPAGRYAVEARHGLVNARARQEIELKAGQPRTLVLEHQAATIRLKLVLTGNPPAADVFWDLRDRNGRSVLTTAQAEPKVTLEAGRYLVRAETRDKRYERIVDLKAGEVVQVEVRE